jgi:hypothetical protein
LFYVDLKDGSVVAGFFKPSDFSIHRFGLQHKEHLHRRLVLPTEVIHLPASAF